MRHLTLLFLFLAVISCNQPVPEQKPEPSNETTTKPSLPQVDTSLYETFSYQDGDTTYVMKKYFICFLKTGPNRDQDEKTAAEIQEKHLAHLSKLAEDQHICMAGPFDDDGEIRGITIFSVPTLEDAKRLAEADPAVQAGRLEVEIHPWWAAVGSQLF